MRTPENRVPPPLTEAEAWDFLALVYHGRHRVPGTRLRRLDSQGTSWRISVQASGLSTFDYDTLTRIVIAAHDHCIRVSVEQGGPGAVALILSRRVRTAMRGEDYDAAKSGECWNSHPTLEQAAAKMRGDRDHESWANHTAQRTRVPT